MISMIQRRLGPFLLVILALLSLPLVFYTTMPTMDRNGSGQALGKIDGHNIQAEDLRDAKTATYAMVTLKFGHLPESKEMDQALNVQAWRRLLLLASARDMGIRVDNQQVVEFVQSRRLFQKDGQYQPELYEQFKTGFLERNNINTQKFEGIVRDEIAIERLQRVVLSPVQVTPDEVKEAFEQAFGKVTLSMILFDPQSYGAKAVANPQEIEQVYKDEIQTNPALRTAERRKVSYVSFRYSPEEQKLTGAAKDEAKRKLADKTLAFSQTLDASTDFSQAAKKQQLTVTATGFFAQNEAPAPLAPSPNFNLAAFHLDTDHPNSSVVETDQGFFMIHLEQIQPSQPKSLAEVRPLIEQAIKKRIGLTMAGETGRAAAAKIKSETAKGVPFTKAAAALNLKTEVLPPFIPADPRLDNDLQLKLVRGIAVSLPVHGVSGFIPTGDGGIIASLDSRQPAEPSAYKDFADQVKTSLLNQAREVALEEWIRHRSESKGTIEPKGLFSKQ